MARTLGYYLLAAMDWDDDIIRSCRFVKNQQTLLFSGGRHLYGHRALNIVFLETNAPNERTLVDSLTGVGQAMRMLNSSTRDFQPTFKTCTYRKLICQRSSALVATKFQESRLDYREVFSKNKNNRYDSRVSCTRATNVSTMNWTLTTLSNLVSIKLIHVSFWLKRLPQNKYNLACISSSLCHLTASLCKSKYIYI